jgi:hypothetical protein
MASQFAPLTGYCRQRLADDPHLPTAGLLAELTVLGYHGTPASLGSALRHHQITRPRCTQCQSSPGFALTSRRITCPVVPEGQLPRTARPVAGEMLGSYLSRLAAANHIDLVPVLALLPRWATGKLTSHRARLPPGQQPAAAIESLNALAVLTGTEPAALARALPAFGGGPGGPARAITACRRCTAARGITHPVPVHWPAWQMACTRHRIWLSRPGRPQLDITACPEIVMAAHHAGRLVPHHTPAEVIYAQLEAAQIITRPPAEETSRIWQQRTRLLRAANPGLNTTTAESELTQAAAYPEIITQAAVWLNTNNRRQQTSGRPAQPA